MQFQFDANQFEPTQGMEVWPDGWVPVVIRTTEAKANRGGAGGHLGLLLEAIDGPLKGKQQYLALNLWHGTSQQAVEIANRTLSAIVYVTLGANQGRLTMNDTNELCNIPFQVLAQRQKDDPSKNNFNTFKDMRGNEPKAQGAGAGAPGPSGPSFGAPPAGPQAPQQWGAPPAAAAAPPAPAAWGAPPAAPAPAAPPQQWGAPPAPPAAPPAAPAWGAPPAPAAAPPAGPPPAAAWGAPPAPPAPQAAPAWGAPPNAAPPAPPAGAPMPAWGAPR